MNVNVTDSFEILWAAHGISHDISCCVIPVSQTDALHVHRLSGHLCDPFQDFLAGSIGIVQFENSEKCVVNSCM